jgi:hypothetical protein
LKGKINKLPKSSTVIDVRQMAIRTAESSVPNPFEAEIGIEKLNGYKLPDTDQIPAGIIQAGGETLLSDVHNLINCVWNKVELPQ